MSVHETIQRLNEKIAEIETYAEMRANDMPTSTKEDIAALANRSIDIIKQVIAKVIETPSMDQDDNFLAFREVIAKCDSAVAYTRSKIDEAVSLAIKDKPIKQDNQADTKIIIQIKANEEVRDILMSIKEVASTIYEQAEIFMARPETKEVIDKTKVEVVRIAEKSLIVLKKLLDVSDEDL